MRFEFIQSCFDFPPFMVERRQLNRWRRLVIQNRCQQPVDGFGFGNPIQPVFDNANNNSIPTMVLAPV